MLLVLWYRYTAPAYACFDASQNRTRRYVTWSLVFWSSPIYLGNLQLGSFFKSSFILFHFVLSWQDNSSSQDSFLVHNSCKNTFPWSVEGLNRPSGSYMDAICFNTFRFDTEPQVIWFRDRLSSLTTHVSLNTLTFSPIDLSPNGILSNTFLSFDVQSGKLMDDCANICLASL